ncbi:MAG: hypothetical protein PVH88_02160 [Ignavibacteria bacterium]|jgi:hypothetical protein
MRIKAIIYLILLIINFTMAQISEPNWIRLHRENLLGSGGKIQSDWLFHLDTLHILGLSANTNSVIHPKYKLTNSNIFWRNLWKIDSTHLFVTENLFGLNQPSLGEWTTNESVSRHSLLSADKKTWGSICEVKKDSLVYIWLVDNDIDHKILGYNENGVFSWTEYTNLSSEFMGQMDKSTCSRAFAYRDSFFIRTMHGGVAYNPSIRSWTAQGFAVYNYEVGAINSNIVLFGDNDTTLYSESGSNGTILNNDWLLEVDSLNDKYYIWAWQVDIGSSVDYDSITVLYEINSTALDSIVYNNGNRIYGFQEVWRDIESLGYPYKMWNRDGYLWCAIANDVDHNVNLLKWDGITMEIVDLPESHIDSAEVVGVYPYDSNNIIMTIQDYDHIESIDSIHFGYQFKPNVSSVDTFLLPTAELGLMNTIDYYNGNLFVGYTTYPTGYINDAPDGNDYDAKTESMFYAKFDFGIISLLQPQNEKAYIPGDTINISWLASQDTIEILILGDTITVSGTEYNYEVPDTSGTFILTARLKNLPGQFDYRTFIVKSNIFLEVVTNVDADKLTIVNEVSKTINISLLSNGVDSVRFYWSEDTTGGVWNLLEGSYSITDDSGIDTSVIEWSVKGIPKVEDSLFVKVEQIADTNIHSLKPPKSGVIVEAGHTGIDKRVCWGSVNDNLPYSQNWCLDLCCKWCTVNWYKGSFRLNSGNSVGNIIGKLPATVSEYKTNQKKCSELWAGDSDANKYYYIDESQNVIKTQIEREVALRSLGIYKNGNFTWNGYSWYVSGNALYVDDLVNGVDSLIVFNFEAYTDDAGGYGYKHFLGDVSVAFLIFDDQDIGSQTKPNPFRPDGSLIPLTEDEMKSYIDTLANQGEQVKFITILYGRGFPGDAILIVDVDFVGNAHDKSSISVSDSFVLTSGTVTRTIFRGYIPQKILELRN